jgi:hypothetical protein
MKHLVAALTLSTLMACNAHDAAQDNVDANGVEQPGPGPNSTGIGKLESQLAMPKTYGTDAGSSSYGGWGWPACDYDKSWKTCMIPNTESNYAVRRPNPGGNWAQQIIRNPSYMLGGSRSYLPPSAPVPTVGYDEVFVDLTTGWNFGLSESDTIVHGSEVVRVACHSSVELLERANGDGARVFSCRHYQIRVDEDAIEDWADYHYSDPADAEIAAEKILTIAYRNAWAVVRGLPLDISNATQANGTRRVTYPLMHIQDMVDTLLPSLTTCSNGLVYSSDRPLFDASVQVYNESVCTD